MKKILITGSLLLLLVGCTSNNERNSNIENEVTQTKQSNMELKDEVVSLKNETILLNKKVDMLNTKVDAIKASLSN